MRKTVSVLLVGLMIVGIMGCMQAIAQEGNELEELVGLKVRIWYAGSFGSLTCKGIIFKVKGNWLIILESRWFGKEEYCWCYIPTIRGIDILDKDYKPEGGE